MKTLLYQILAWPFDRLLDLIDWILFEVLKGYGEPGE